MKTRLIFVEGLPGSGKSTFSRFISVQAERNQQKIRWYHEVAKPHPTCFFHEAWLRLAEYEALISKHPQVRNALEQLHFERGEWICFDLLDVQRQYGAEIGEEAYRDLSRYDVWSFAPDTYREVSLVKWRHFVETTLVSEETVMLDSSMFQFQIYGRLLEDLPPAEIKRWVHELMEIVAPLRPVLVYFYQQDVEQAIENLFAVRGQAWVESIVERDANTPYFRARSTPGVDTYAQLLKDYRHLADESFAECAFPKIGIDVAQREWSRYERQLLDFLGLTYVADPPVSAETLRSLAGVYRNTDIDVSVEISVEDDVLYFGKAKKNLIPKSALTFYINDNSVEVTFAEKAGLGMVMTMGGLPLIDRWSETGTEYVCRV